MPASAPTGRCSTPNLSSYAVPGAVKIFRGKATGAHSDRRQLLTMSDTLAPGDLVTVTRIDHLARSTFDLFGIVKQIVDAKAQFRSLAEPWADTGTSTRRLMICRTRRPRGRGARSNSHPHRRGAQPGAEARAAYGRTFETDTGPEGRGPPPDARRVLRLPNSHAAMASTRARFPDCEATRVTFLNCAQTKRLAA